MLNYAGRATCLLLIAAVLFVVAACATPAPPPDRSPSSEATKVLVFVEENHSLDQMKAGMPKLFALAQSHAYATEYKAITHPSEPNYMAIAAGSTLGDSSNHNPAWQVHGQSIFGAALANGKTAKSYAESMTSSCQQSNTGAYAVKHNPWPSFTDERSACDAGNPPMGTYTSGALHDDIVNGTLPNVGLAVPNLDNDAHDGSLGTADNWLTNWMDLILASPDYQAGRLAVIVTADEDNHSEDNRVLTVVIHPSQSGGKVVSSALSHYSLTGLYNDVSGVSRLRDAASAPGFAAAFDLPVSSK